MRLWAGGPKTKEDGLASLHAWAGQGRGQRSPGSEAVVAQYICSSPGGGGVRGRATWGFLTQHAVRRGRGCNATLGREKRAAGQARLRATLGARGAGPRPAIAPHRPRGAHRRGRLGKWAQQGKRERAQAQAGRVVRRSQHIFGVTPAAGGVNRAAGARAGACTRTHSFVLGGRKLARAGRGAGGRRAP
ncbi:MAG: hypothetical protein J3K34DRAFT_27927 [Monoraphidium minutum]|nr:MAG: hypothetical protein J3K34DRAFT_27927 [Monoraphidium minutum]